MPRSAQPRKYTVTVISSVGEDDSYLLRAIGRTLEILAEEKRKHEGAPLEGSAAMKVAERR